MTWHDRMVRRLALGLGTMSVGGVAVLVMALSGWAHSLGLAQWSVAMSLAMAMGLGGMGYLLLGLRCPACRLRLFMHVARHAPAGTTIGAMLGLRQCPRCGTDLRGEVPG